MKVIWKYKLIIIDVQELQMPFEAEILSTQIQDDIICLWAKVDSQQKLYKRCIQIIGTGNPIDETFNVSRVFIDTVQLDGFVWHIFERIIK